MSRSSLPAGRTTPAGRSAQLSLFLTEILQADRRGPARPGGGRRPAATATASSIRSSSAMAANSPGMAASIFTRRAASSSKPSRAGGRTARRRSPARRTFSPPRPTWSRAGSGADRNWDVLMINARRQAEDYAKALPPQPTAGRRSCSSAMSATASRSMPTSPGRGRTTRSSRTGSGFRIYLDDLREPEIRGAARAIWEKPAVARSRPRQSARVTREIAVRLAAVSKRLEARQWHDRRGRCAHSSCAACSRCSPRTSNCCRRTASQELLGNCARRPGEVRADGRAALGGDGQGRLRLCHRRRSCAASTASCFKQAKVLPLEARGDRRAAGGGRGTTGREVEPAIFGTLLERALDPDGAPQLGAHYTPRAYVERLVLATVIEPLRAEWAHVQAHAPNALTTERRQARRDRRGPRLPRPALRHARARPRLRHRQLPLRHAGTDEAARRRGAGSRSSTSAGQEALRGFEGHTVDPHQFLGLEINPRAAAIAELVLWIGYLQWHFRNQRRPSGRPDPARLRQHQGDATPC